MATARKRSTVKWVLLHVWFLWMVSGLLAGYRHSGSRKLMPEWPERVGSFRLSFSVFRGQPSLPAPPPPLTCNSGKLEEGHGGGQSRAVRGWNGRDGMSAAENYKSAGFQGTKPCAEKPVGCWRRFWAFFPRGKELGAGRDRESSADSRD